MCVCVCVCVCVCLFVCVCVYSCTIMCNEGVLIDKSARISRHILLLMFSQRISSTNEDKIREIVITILVCFLFYRSSIKKGVSESYTCFNCLPTE